MNMKNTNQATEITKYTERELVFSDEATSHLTKAGKSSSQVAGYVISVCSVANGFSWY
jgi:hypothetical protein